MLNRDHASDRAHFFVGLLGIDEVIDGENKTCNMLEPDSPDCHRGPEASVKGGCGPGSSKVGRLIEICQGLRALKAYDLAEIA